MWFLDGRYKKAGRVMQCTFIRHSIRYRPMYICSLVSLAYCCTFGETSNMGGPHVHMGFKICLFIGSSYRMLRKYEFLPIIHYNVGKIICRVVTPWSIVCVYIQTFRPHHRRPYSVLEAIDKMSAN